MTSVFRARRAAERCRSHHLPAADDDLKAFRGFSAAGVKRHLRHRSDAGHGLSTEPEGGNGKEIFFTSDLACGMCLETENGIIGIHPLPVIGDADQLFTRFLHGNRDLERTGIKGVFKEFLQHRGGTFDHLPCCDFIIDIFGQKLDSAHSFPPDF